MHPTLRPLSLLLLTATLAAQSIPPRGPDSTTRTQIPGVEVLAFPNLPFSATDTVIRSQPMEGGGTVTTFETSKVFRDSQGRVYRERHHFAPKDIDPAKTIYEFYILDPVAHTRTTCTLAVRQCEITNFFPHLNLALMPTGPFDNGKQFLARESLGDQSIDGIPTTGTRETTTIYPEAIGNDLALTLTREFWYSTDLKTNLVVTRSDPREGTINVHLTVLSRSEPDPLVFAIPSNFQLHDLRSPAQHAALR